MKSKFLLSLKDFKFVFLYARSEEHTVCPVLAGWGLDRARAVPALLGFVAVNALTLALLAARPGIRALGGPREWGGGPDA